MINHVAIAGHRILATSQRGIFVKANSTWSGPALAGSQISAITTAGARVFAAVSGIAGSDVAAGIYVSEDGVQWRLLSEAPPDVTALAADGNFLYAGTDGSSVFMMALSRRRRAAR